MTIKIAPLNLDFGELPRGGVAPPQAIHVLNETENEYFINSVSVSGQYTTDDIVGKTLGAFELEAGTLTALANTVSVCEHDKFVFVASTSMGVISLSNEVGTLKQLSAYTPLTVTSASKLHHDGRFLYLTNADGIHSFKADQFGALTLLDTIKPNAGAVLDVTSDGVDLYVVDATALTLLRVDNRGQFSTVSENTTAKGVSVAVLGEYSFVADTTRIYSVKKSNADNLVLQTTYTGAAANLDNLVVVRDKLPGRIGVLFATLITGGNVEVIAGTVDEGGEFVYSGVKYSVAAASDQGLFYDGVLLHLFADTVHAALSVELPTMALAALKSFSTDAKAGIFYDGDIITLVTTGLQAYSFGDCRLKMDAKFNALGSGGIPGEVDVGVFKIKEPGETVLISVAKDSTSGMCQVSEDGGLTWTEYAMPVNGVGYYKVTVGNGVAIAVADGTKNSVARSVDYGKTWTLVAVPSGLWRDSAYLDGVWIIVGTGGVALRSVDDGMTWTSISLPYSNSWISVDGGNGVFAASAISGDSRRVMRSSDKGLTWTNTTASSYLWYSIKFGNGNWVILSNSSRVAVSTDDAASFTTYTLPENNYWYGLSYGNGRFSAVSADGTNRTMRSLDGGVTWTVAVSAEQNKWRSITYVKDNIFVAVSENGTNRIQRTTDGGVTWSAIPAASAHSWRGICRAQLPDVPCETRVITKPITLTGVCQIDDHVPETAMTLPSDTRWDRIDRFKLNEIKDANRIPVQIKARINAPQGAVIDIPTDATPANDEAPAQAWRK